MATSSWSAGLCGCGDGCGTCCVTWYCPCITFGRNAEAVDEGHSSCVANCCIYALLMTLACQCLYSCAYRKKLRSKYGLRPEPCGDCCVHFCCGPCALCQEHAELKRRGAFDHPKGYAAPNQHVMHR